MIRFEHPMTGPRIAACYETQTAERIAAKLADGESLVIYNQATTGSMYGRIELADGRVYMARISDHPTRTTTRIIETARKKAIMPAKVQVAV